MAALRVFGITTLALFAVIGVIGVVKKGRTSHEEKGAEVVNNGSQKIESQEVPAFAKEPITYKEEETAPKVGISLEVASEPLLSRETALVRSDEANIDRMHQLFTTGDDKLPFVETLSYKSRVGWLQGRPAWIADYASYYATSRHFIARSLNANRDYYTQKVSSGDRFNVFKKDKDLRFYLVVDLSQLRMWFYAYDADINMRYLLKSYKVGCGKLDQSSPSGCLTPLGTFTLGDKIAIYKPGVEGLFKDQKIEMIQVFGTRWLPYKGEQDEALALVKGLGMHGSPWARDEVTGELIEKKDSIGCYDSSGCVRLLQEDIEELFAIVITKPTTVQIVKNLQEAKLPGVEWMDHVVVSTN